METTDTREEPFMWTTVYFDSNCPLSRTKFHKKQKKSPSLVELWIEIEFHSWGSDAQ